MGSRYGGPAAVLRDRADSRSENSPVVALYGVFRGSVVSGYPRLKLLIACSIPIAYTSIRPRLPMEVCDI